MKAIVYTKYGPPDVLELNEIEKPTPKGDEVLIKIQAASANPADWHMLRGEPFLARLNAGLFKPKNTILGIDIAGQVEAVGKNVTEFQLGDEVFGGSDFGGFAEYVCVTEKNLVLKPTHITFEEAAAVPVAALTALQGFRQAGQIRPGQKVLINGASGGVGTVAVQIAKSFGAEVSGVCTGEDFTKTGQRYDLIIDNVGNRSVSDLQRALSPQGICVIVGFSSLALLFQAMFLGPLISMTGSQKIGLMGVANVNKKDLGFLKELLEAGKVKPVIDRRYPLREVAEAIRYLEGGHAQGKVVITV
jgi:NADPH:quinone reductase-like Zn-dependent oxidoreductase